MWRMALVAALAAVVYFVVPLAAPGPPPVDSDSFGKPWTFTQFEEELRNHGLAVESGGPLSGWDEVYPPRQVTGGRINDFPFIAMVYKDKTSVALDWKDDGGVLVLPRERGDPVTPSFSYVLDNVVITVGTGFDGPGYDFSRIEESIVAVQEG